ncbi:MAG: ATP phosphoribosyltransferase regulatory subunit [candidate division KSB1 bacterium]|nr:ATP phosphoribosyltransferase regulatory subunit [candidate division KSB1 bacterium]MDZ7274405.1 ATP phosphoribosyltransferase regulatory subunit [candidate division KSB1 bacterium]MDZ7284933.1 ATP phosphoribosyltransferase regulatory subunit [candidate division KSB1 bacterium]MDZ7297646.1 ATP phosphoribosyltransferase regulatory subunit [candidate division KSB1 bacterium]MDZ7348513.1 ATP phosphoribosyltransferase regulatory subunit [candidate division KSB1 bacterium]
MMPYHLRQLPAGLKDYLFEEAQRRRSVEHEITAALRQHGYREIITPTFEHWEVFATAGRNGWQEKIYRFLDREGNLVALRSDFTAQVARLVAQKHAALSFPLRLFYSGKVFRFEELHAGRSRECWQVGFELLGDTGLPGDVEAVALVAQALRALQLGAFQINLGTIGYFNGVVREARLTPAQLGEIKRLLSHKDADTLAGFLQQVAPPPAVQEALTGLMQWHGGREILEQAGTAAPNAETAAALDHLRRVYNHLEAMNWSQHVVIDLSEVQGMHYYSGIMIKAYVPGLGYEVGSGGRYDQLLSQFGHDCPAVGFSFDVDRLVEAIAG